jgi:hypothetical protein
VEAVINVVYEYDPIPGCPMDGFMVRYAGFVTVPDGVTSVRFAIASDDGSHFTIDGTSFGDWTDKGCSIDYAPRRVYDTGVPLPLEGWVYENGGGTCAMLFWQLDSDQGDWSIVPEQAFTVDAVAPTTTTSTTSTTSTTTTEPTTTTSTTTTSIPVTTTDYQPVTSSTMPSTTAPAPTIIQTTSSTSSTVSPMPTTTAVNIASTSIENAPTTTTSSTIQPSTTTTLAPIREQMSPAEALAEATDPEVVASLSGEEATEVFAAIDESALTLEQAAQIVEAVQDAPDEVRQAFEDEVNVFGGKTDNYIPLFSNIPVGKRRTMIAATGMMTVIPPPTRRRLT